MLATFTLVVIKGYYGGHFSLTDDIGRLCGIFALVVTKGSYDGLFGVNSVQGAVMVVTLV